MKKPIIDISGVTFSYANGPAVLKDLSLSIRQGTFMGVTGRNGSGKTTFLYLLNGLIPQMISGNFQGEVRVAGVSTKEKNVAYFSHKVGLLFQNPDFSLFNLTVEEEVSFGLENLGYTDIKNRVQKALESVGLSDFISRDPHSLSYGQKQKVNLACVLAMDPAVVVMDEPSAMLDYESASSLYGTLRLLHSEGKTIIVVEHDTDFLARFAQEVIILGDGGVVLHTKTKKAFSDERLLDKYGVKTPKH